MEIAKRIVNLIYALLMIFFGAIAHHNISAMIKLLLGLSAIFAVINFALFKKFTVWNK